MHKIIEFEFSPNGILGRVLRSPSGEVIVYPGVFLGLAFDVYMPRGVPVYGPDVPPDTAYRYEHGKMEATLPEPPPALEDTHLSTGGTIPKRLLPRPKFSFDNPPRGHATHAIAHVPLCPCRYCSRPPQFSRQNPVPKGHPI